MSDDTVKTYKNPARTKIDAVRQPYVPQYQTLGIEPITQDIKTLPVNVLIARIPSQEDNPRTRRLNIRQPYAKPEELSSTIGNSSIPNVGNNIEQTWAGVDSQMIDDISGEVVQENLNPDHQMIDNNYTVNIPGLLEEVQLDASNDTEPKKFMTKQDLLHEVKNDLSVLPDDHYILLLKGTIVSTGSMKDIEELAGSLVFGEHPLCDGRQIPVEDIVVLKKIKLKLGLFLE
jgi:hypothetical protein